MNLLHLLVVMVLEVGVVYVLHVHVGRHLVVLVDHLRVHVHDVHVLLVVLLHKLLHLLSVWAVTVMVVH